MYNSAAYKRSRIAYTGQCTFEYFATILATDAFLATLLLSMGISEAMIGVITTISSVAFLFQIFSLVLTKKIKNVKPFAIVFNTLSQVFFIALYLLPFFNVSVAVKTVLSISCVLLAYICNYVMTGFIFSWGNSFVEPTKRARFSATKEIVSLISGMIFSVVVGKVFTNFQQSGNIEAGFIFISIALLINNICNFICLISIKKQEPKADNNENESIRQVLKKLLMNKSYVLVVMILLLKAFAQAFSLGFLGTFKTKDLMISVGTVQVINVAGNLFRAVLSRPLGAYSDKFSYVKGLKLGIFIEILAFLCIAFVNGPSRWWLIIAYTILYNISLAGTNANSSNIMFSYVDIEHFVQATAIKNVLCGVTSFATALFASKLFEYIQNNGNKFAGLSIYPQQLFAIITIVVLSIAIVCIRRTLEGKEIKVQ